jgi:hypothetical protein
VSELRQRQIWGLRVCFIDAGACNAPLYENFGKGHNIVETKKKISISIGAVVQRSVTGQTFRPGRSLLLSVPFSLEAKHVVVHCRSQICGTS